MYAWSIEQVCMETCYICSTSGWKWFKLAIHSTYLSHMLISKTTWCIHVTGVSDIPYLHIVVQICSIPWCMVGILEDPPRQNNHEIYIVYQPQRGQHMGWRMESNRTHIGDSPWAHLNFYPAIHNHRSSPANRSASLQQENNGSAPFYLSLQDQNDSQNNQKNNQKNNQNRPKAKL